MCICRASVAHAYNPSYSGSRDQEDRSSNPALANSLRGPILKKTHHKKGLLEWFKVQAMSSNPSTTKKKKEWKWVYTCNPSTQEAEAGGL
jgi:hypothetical protein